MQAERLAAAGISVVDHEGAVYLEIWLDGRPDSDKPIRVALRPGEALDLAGKLPPAVKRAVAYSMGCRI